MGGNGGLAVSLGLLDCELCERYVMGPTTVKRSELAREQCALVMSHVIFFDRLTGGIHKIELGD